MITTWLRINEQSHGGIVATVQTILVRRSRGNRLSAFKWVLAQTGLPDIRFHDLHHTLAGLMLQEGIHPGVVQERLRRAENHAALDISSREPPRLVDKAAAKMDGLIDGNPTQPA